MVLLILVETTCPILVLRRFFWSFAVAVSAIYFFLALPAVSAAASSFSRMMVFTRATSLRRPRIFFRLSVCPILSWNFRRKSWSLSSRSCCLSSASVRFLIFSASIIFFVATFFDGSKAAFLMCPRHELGLKSQLVRRQAHGFLRFVHGHTFHFKQHTAGTNYSDPMIRSAFAFAHTGFSR